MPRTVFVSYSHQQGEWVWDRLVPVLKAAGVEVLIDREQFEAARALDRQMDEVQDRAHSTLLVLSPDHLASPACQREMKRAIDKDPTFTTSPAPAIPIVREPCTLPGSIRFPNPLYLDFADDRNNEPWEKLLDVCDGSLLPGPPAWLHARDECRTLLEARQSINLEVEDGAAWRTLLKHLKDEYFPDLGVLDLHRGAAASRKGFVQELLRECGAGVAVPDKPHDLGVLETTLKARRKSRVAITHFDAVAAPDYQAEYGYALFNSLRDLVTEHRVLNLLAVSRNPAVSLFPQDHPLSNLNLQTVELRSRR